MNIFTLQEKSLLFVNETSVICREESRLLIMAIALRHNQTDVELEDNLHLIYCHLPYEEYTSKYGFCKCLPEKELVKYYYCPQCLTSLDLLENSTNCRYCKQQYTKSSLEDGGSYFVYIPLTKQIIDIVNSYLYTHLRQQCNESDVINGNVYKQLLDNNIIGKNDLSIQWNVDGVSYFKSSNCSIWPIQMSVNELPYRLGKKNIILCGLWEGVNKPCMNLYLKPFVTELIELQNNGIFFTTFLHIHELIKIKVYAILCIVDSVARPMVQNMKQFNGVYGCPYCYHKGEMVASGNGHARVYDSLIKELCTKAKHEEHVRKVVELDKAVKGVKGPAVTSLVWSLDIINAYPSEYMHGCLLGITKLFVRAWFN